MFLRIFKHLLPRAKAWSITVNKNLRKFWDALTVLGEEFKTYADTIIYDNFYSQRTELITEWEVDLGLPPASGLTEQQRRDRIDGVRKALGGQSPQYIQDTLRAAGFDVYIHEWWLPMSNPPVVREPLDYLRRHYLPQGGITERCGEILTACGEEQALCGNTDEKIGYPLVNKIEISYPDFIVLCGEPEVLCGAPEAMCGDFNQLIYTQRDYIIPTDPNRWPFFVYIGAEVFPELAIVPNARRDEFENLCLKLCPLQLWIGILVKYV